MIKDIVIPKQVKQGIKPLRRGARKMIKCIGGDTETKNGRPITYQFTQDKIKDIIWIKKKTTFKYLIDYFNLFPAHDDIYVVWIHNLDFDICSFFYDRLEILKDELIDFDYGPWHITGIFSSNTHFLKFVHRSGHKTIHMLDTMHFFLGSLDRLSLLFDPKRRKLKAPDGLGKKDFSPEDEKFVEYALRDSEIAEIIGKYIVDMHNEYDISISVSQAQMSSKIFRKHFLKRPIPFPTESIRRASEHSYHGGKNGFYCNTGLYKNVFGLDIISAYPHAMSIMPSFSNIDLYYEYESKGPVDEVPNYGVYKIYGELKDCKYPIIFNAGFKRAEKLDGIWVTGWELNEAIRAKEVNLSNCYGFFYDAESDNVVSPFKMFVEEFYTKKDKAKNDVDRQFYKVILNSLYGKFIQTNKSLSRFLNYEIETGEISNTKQIKAGAMYNPFIASLITGHTRAMIHKYEHRYNALHTATDGIITTKTLKKSSTKLGGLKQEFNNDVYIVRNKLYLIYSEIDFYTDKLTKKKVKRQKSKVVKGKYIEKFAFHGFQGNADDLENIILKIEKGDLSDLTYSKIRRNTLKDGLNRGLTVNDFELRNFKLNKATIYLD
jgi:hypothetical protein